MWRTDADRRVHDALMLRCSLHVGHDQPLCYLLLPTHWRLWSESREWSCGLPSYDVCCCFWYALRCKAYQAIWICTDHLLLRLCRRSCLCFYFIVHAILLVVCACVRPRIRCAHGNCLLHPYLHELSLLSQEERNRLGHYPLWLRVILSSLRFNLLRACQPE